MTEDTNSIEEAKSESSSAGNLGDKEIGTQPRDKDVEDMVGSLDLYLTGAPERMVAGETGEYDKSTENTLEMSPDFWGDADTETLRCL